MDLISQCLPAVLQNAFQYLNYINEETETWLISGRV